MIWEQVKEKSKLFALSFSVLSRRLAEYFYTANRYYKIRLFAKADIHLHILYFFLNPFRISRRFLEAQGAEDIYTYGETPLCSMESIAKECGINSKDYCIELGCGRGRTCLWLATVLGCQTKGIEWVPSFIKRAQAVQKFWKIKNLEYTEENFLHTDLSKASVIYCYGTCMNEDEIDQLIKALKGCKNKCKIITVSFPLEDEEGRIKLDKSFKALFTWGTAEVYLHHVSPQKSSNKE
jgi:hypothetical protein